MTSYEFEVAAKNAIMDIEHTTYKAQHNIIQIHTVWMTHVLGNKKGIFICGGPNNRMYEVTYNADKREMYVDAYIKDGNKKLTEFDITA